MSALNVRQRSVRTTGFYGVSLSPIVVRGASACFNGEQTRANVSSRALEAQNELDSAAAFGDARTAPSLHPVTALPKLSTSSYRLLSDFRYEIRKFVSFSEHAAREAEIEPQQHQLLLAVRGLPEGVRPTIGALAERLCVQHHTAVALTDKLESRELLSRQRSASDKREVLLQLTAKGDAILRKLSARHWDQLAAAGPAMVAALQELVRLASTGQAESTKKIDSPATPASSARRAAKPKASLAAPIAAKVTRSVASPKATRNGQR